MFLVNVYWPLPVNRLRVLCNCGATLNCPSHVSLVQFPKCGRSELWHGVVMLWGIKTCCTQHDAGTSL